MIKEILTYDIYSDDNPAVLQEKCRLVNDFQSQETKQCIEDLNDTLDELIKTEGNKRGAIGLSANQIGYDLAMSAVTLGDQRYMLINPKLIKENGKERLFRIGCFSLYKYRAMVRYNDEVVISYYDEDGNKKELSLQGDRSCVVQHEMDHLVGDLLFERLEHKKEDLFVPRESLYKDGSIPPENHGPLFEENRKKGLNKVMDAPTYYSSLFNDYSDYVSLIEKTAKERKELLDMIIRHTPANARILEADESTSVLSVYLNKNGYRNDACIFDPDMKDLDERINAQNKTAVNYHSGNITRLPFSDKTFETIFSYGILETLDDEKLSLALKEGLRIADIYIFEVPTIDFSGNTLKGNERLRDRESWENQLSQMSLKIIEVKEKDGFLIFAVKSE